MLKTQIMLKNAKKCKEIFCVKTIPFSLGTGHQNTIVEKRQGEAYESFLCSIIELISSRPSFQASENIASKQIVFPVFLKCIFV